jgi:hypothetical protein
MSGYSSTIRWILENDIDLGLDTYPLFDEDYRIVLNSNIINHYMYVPEIGFETVERFKFELNQKMQEIMPKYNQLYESALLKLDPFKTFDRTSETARQSKSDDKHDETIGRNESLERDETTEGLRKDNVKNTNVAERKNEDETTASNNQAVKNVNDVTSSSKQVESDTPTEQLLTGDISGNIYATKVIVKDDDNKTKADSVSQEQTKQNNTSNQNEQSKSNQDTTSDISSTINVVNVNDIDTVIDKTLQKIMKENFKSLESGFESVSMSELLLKYRQTFINIDEMIIKELRCKFMYIYKLNF